jgi:positive phototaxis protein PixI
MLIPTSLSRLEQLLPQLFESSLPEGDAYLRFQLTADLTVSISMAQVQESLLVEVENITPLPNMSESIIGLMSSHDQVFCVVDLAQLILLSSTLISARKYHIVVVKVSDDRLVDIKIDSPQERLGERELYLGFAVNHIQGIVRIIPGQIQSPKHNFPICLTDYIHGAVIESEQQLLILNIEAIAHAAYK